MIRIFLPFTFICLFAFSAPAQTADTTEIAAAIETLRLAMINPQKTILENLAADQLSYGHSSGMIEDKAAFIDEFVLGRSIFVTITLSNQTIKISGENAIVRHRLTGDTNNKNMPAKIDIRVLMIWQKQNGSWKLLARQAFKV